MLTSSRKYNLTPVYVTILVLVFVVAGLNLSFYKLQNENTYPVMVQTGPAVTGIGPASFRTQSYGVSGANDMSYSASFTTVNRNAGRVSVRTSTPVVGAIPAASYSARGIEGISKRSVASSAVSSGGAESIGGFSSGRSNSSFSSGVSAPVVSMPGMPSDLRLMARANSLLPADEEVLSAIASNDGATLQRLPGTPTSTDGFETPIPSGVWILLMMAAGFGAYKVLFVKS